jgi:hypothetical protein
VRWTIGCLVGVAVGFWLDDPADPLPPETITVTETVEVEGPEVVRYEQTELPASCLTYIDRYLGQIDAIEQYSSAVSVQFVNFNDALQAIHSGDIGEVNRTITVQHQVEAKATGPLQQLIGEQHTIDRMQVKCDEDMEKLQ